MSAVVASGNVQTMVDVGDSVGFGKGLKSIPKW